MNRLHRTFFIGQVGVEETDGAITGIYLPGDSQPPETGFESPLLHEAFRQLTEYFDGVRQSFELPIQPHGTPFMLQVWSEVRKIPYGQTATYKEIAERTGNDKRSRAVGLANHRNDIPLLIPCHRVIGANGKLVGFAAGIDLKRTLLDHERKQLHLPLM